MPIKINYRSSALLFSHVTIKWVFEGLRNNKGADQPAHLCSLISTFVIQLLESIIYKLVTSEISIF